MFVTGSESPIVVVLSGSMEPAFYRGDLLFLDGPDKTVETGDIVVFQWPGREIPIVHRVIRVHEPRNKTTDITGLDPNRFYLLTKGDNNRVDDRGLYPRGHLWLRPEHIVGRVRGYMPGVGRVTILMNEMPYLKFALLGILGLLVLTSSE